jgi:hypothetical protein
MNARKHARLAHELITACGGLDEAAAACRVGKSSLSDYQNPCLTAFMPADVICDLEAYCGDALYSRAMMESRPSEPTRGDIMVETHEAVQAAAALLPLALAAQQGKPGAKKAFEEAVARLQSEVDDVEAIANVVPMRGAQ